MSQPAPCDLLIAHASVLTMDDQRRILDDGAVAIRGREIVAVGPTAELQAAYAPARAIDGSGRAERRTIHRRCTRRRRKQREACDQRALHRTPPMDQRTSAKAVRDGYGCDW